MSTVTRADRLREIESSPTLVLAATAKALAKAGKSIADFTAGEPDLPTPAHIKQAGIAAIERNETRYTPIAGIQELREAIAASVNRMRGTSYRASNVIVTCGTKHALFNVFQALCQPGDDVLVFSPYWVSFPSLVRLSGARPVIIETHEAKGFFPDPSTLRAAITPTTKAVIINSPSNPTGAVIDPERLRSLATIAYEHGLIVVSDEIYDQLVYPPVQHTSVVQLGCSAAAEQTVIVGGVSKTYAMTGWRIGYAVGPQPLIEAMIDLQSHSTSNPTSISQHAALAALIGDQRPVAEMVTQFQARRDRLVNGLNRLAPLRCTMPGGAFYAWCDIRGLKQPASVIASRWLEDALVATIPGEGFGSSDYIRLSFATSMDTIDRGLERMATWLKQQGS